MLGKKTLNTSESNLPEHVKGKKSYISHRVFFKEVQQVRILFISILILGVFWISF